MTRYRLCFICLFIMICLLVAVMIRPEPASGHGMAHPKYVSMNQGGEARRHDGLIWIGWAYGAVQIALFSGMLAVGLRRNEDGKAPWLVPIASITLAFLLAYTALIVSYVRVGDQPGPLASVPWPTLLMLLGVWAVPMLFIVLYLASFSQWIYSAADAERFAALKLQVEARSNRG